MYGGVIEFLDSSVHSDWCVEMCYSLSGLILWL